MKRKVALIGPSTLMLSLPSKFVKKFGIKKGDELDVDENGNSLVIKLGENRKNEIKELNLANYEVMIKRMIGGLYKRGYNEAKIFFNNPKQLEVIYKTINENLTGFEIINQTSNFIVVKEVSKGSIEDFDNIFRRCFLFVLSSAKESLEQIKKGSYNELRTIALKDAIINKYADFCRRLLNKNYLPTEKSNSLYYILEQLEKIGDVYRDICNYLANNKIKISKDTIKTYEEVNKLLESCYYLFYKFSLEKFDRFGIQFNSFSKINYKNKEEFEMASSLDKIKELIFDMNGSILITHLDNI